MELFSSRSPDGEIESSNSGEPFRFERMPTAHCRFYSRGVDHFTVNPGRSGEPEGSMAQDHVVTGSPVAILFCFFFVHSNPPKPIATVTEKSDRDLAIQVTTIAHLELESLPGYCPIFFGGESPFV